MTCYVVQNFQVRYCQPDGGQDTSMVVDLAQAIRQLDQTEVTPQIVLACVNEGTNDIVTRFTLSRSAVVVDFAGVITSGTLSIDVGF